MFSPEKLASSFGFAFLILLMIFTVLLLGGGILYVLYLWFIASWYTVTPIVCLLIFTTYIIYSEPPWAEKLFTKVFPPS